MFWNMGKGDRGMIESGRKLVGEVYGGIHNNC
jgi:hypothetical protein